MSNFKEQYEAGIAMLICEMMIDRIIHRITHPVMTCRNLVPQFLPDVLTNGIRIVLEQGDVDDEFDCNKLEHCFRAMEPNDEPSNVLQAAWRVHDRSNAVTSGIAVSVFRSSFSCFRDDWVAYLFDGVFSVMNELQSDGSSARPYNEETFLDFCDVADSLTIAQEEQDTQ